MTQPARRWRLMMLRAERRLTQAKLAKRIKTTTWRVNQIEVGRLEPRPEERERMARLFGTEDLGL